MTNKNNKIVVIDDEESVLISTGLLLRLLKYDFITFQNPGKALEYVNSHNVDLILLDLMMPVIDGFTFLQRLDRKNINTNCKVILHTGMENQTYIDKCFKIGAEGCLKKPYSKNEFAKILKENLK